MLAKLRTFSRLGIEAVPAEGEVEYAVVSGLSLEGRTRPANGALSMALSAARQQRLRHITWRSSTTTDISGGRRSTRPA
jgi:hypothetical protein